MYSTGQENSCSFFLVEENLVKTQRCTVCLLASDYLLFLTPFSSNKKIRENEVANSQSRRLCSAPTSMTVLNDRPQEIEAVWKFSLALSFCTEGNKEREADSPHKAEAPRPPRPSFVLFIRELLPVLNSTVSGLASPRFHE